MSARPSLALTGAAIIETLAEATRPRPRRRIVTTCMYPPIPIRDFDWCAHDDNYEPGCIIGWGSTESEAIADYLQLVEDAEG